MSESIEKMRRPAVGSLLAAILGAALLASFLRPMLSSDFDAFPGDYGDALLILYTLEHWYRWIALGQGHWLASAAYFPLSNTLGYTDAGFLLALPFGLARDAGISLVSAYQLTLAAALTMGFAGFYYLLRKEFGLGRIPSLSGCAVALLNNGAYLSVGHTQLFAIGFVPVLLIALVRFFKASGASFGQRFGWGAVAAIVAPLLLYTGYYTGWFTIFVLVTLGVLYLVHDQFTTRGAGRIRCLTWSKRHALELMGYAVLFLVALCPFVITYLPILRQSGGRPFDEVLPMLPQWFDFINVGPTSALWGPLWSSTFPGAGGRPFSWELAKGVPPITLILFVISAIAIWSENIRFAADGPPQHRLRSERDRGLAMMLASLLALAVIACWLLQLKLGSGSAWWLVHKTVPGATGIRAAFRLQHVLALPIGFVIAVALNRAIAQHSRSSGNVLLPGSTFGQIVVLALVVADQYNLTLDTYRGSKAFVNSAIAKVPSPPVECRAFFVTDVSPQPLPGYVISTLAMLTAQRLNVPTINGYTSGPPPGWGLNDPQSEEYLTNVVAWVDRNRLVDGLCKLEFPAGRWSSVDFSKAKAPVRMEGPLGADDYRVELSLSEGVATMKPGETRKVRLRVHNLGTTTWSSLGLDDGRFGVMLSYQWVDANGKATGFKYRKQLPSAVEPGNNVLMTAEVTAPVQPGSYELQFDLVQEFVAWFRDKGHPGLAVHVDVK